MQNPGTTQGLTMLYLVIDDGCIRSLQRAVDGGYFNYHLMLSDSDLDSVRDDPKFKEILEKAKEKHLAFKKKFFPDKT